MHAQATSVRLENNFFFKLHESVGNYYFLYYETNKEALYVLCSAVKHLRGG